MSVRTKAADVRSGKVNLHLLAVAHGSLHTLTGPDPQNEGDCGYCGGHGKPDGCRGCGA